MPVSRPSQVIQRLRQAALAQEGGPTDVDLMNRFVVRRDSDALETLVRRHGSMVLAVCRRVLGNQQDAEDAFQAVFLVFVRKAASIRARDLIGNWLYGVAYRTALKARTAAARRRVKERQAANMVPSKVEPEAGASEWLPLLDQELNRLPDKYRIAIVLCELEGRPRKEAARRLGVPEGTLSSRLATGRRMLARRLARHGPAPSAGILSAGLAHGTASAGVPSPLLASTLKAAALVAAGQAAVGVVSVRVVALAEGVVKTMLLAKLSAVTVLAAFVVVAVGAAVFVLGAHAAEPAPAHKNPPGAPAAQAASEEKPEVQKEKPEWGDAVDGVQARLRPAKAAWDAGETPEFTLDLRNQGKRTPNECRVSNFCEIEWDGQWYRWGGYGDLDCPVINLDPGKEIDEWVKPSLKDPWLRGRPARLIGDIKGEDEPLVMAAGRHTLRVAFVFERTLLLRFGEGLNTEIGERDHGIRVVSQLVEVEVGKESAWGDAKGGVQARLRTPKAVWKVGEAPTFILDLRVAAKTNPHALRIKADLEIEVDGTWYWYPNEPDRRVRDILGWDKLDAVERTTDWVSVVADKNWEIKKPGAAAGKPDRFPLPAGKHTIRISYEVTAGADSFRPVSGPVEIEVGAEAAWGEATDGVQARLQPSQSACDEGRSPDFKVDLRNQGKNAPPLCRLPQFCEIEFDGEWYEWGGAVAVDRLSSPLKPGDEVDGCVTFTLDDPWVRTIPTPNPNQPNIGSVVKERLRAVAGKHTMRVAFSFDGRAILPRPVSNPVEIEVGKESAWGDADGGVQARIRIPRVQWKTGEAPRFYLDLRNRGKTTPNARRVPLDCQIEVGGIWYSYDLPSGPYPAVGDLLEPGMEIRPWVTVAPDKHWESLTAKKEHFPLPAGKHTIRIAYPLQGVAPGIRPVSGPVEIEVREEVGK